MRRRPKGRTKEALEYQVKLDIRLKDADATGRKLIMMVVGEAKYHLPDIVAEVKSKRLRGVVHVIRREGE